MNDFLPEWTQTSDPPDWFKIPEPDIKTELYSASATSASSWVITCIADPETGDWTGFYYDPLYSTVQPTAHSYREMPDCVLFMLGVIQSSLKDVNKAIREDRKQDVK